MAQIKFYNYKQDETHRPTQTAKTNQTKGNKMKTQIEMYVRHSKPANIKIDPIFR